MFVQPSFISFSWHSTTMKDFSSLSKQVHKHSFHILSYVLYQLPKILK